MRRYDYLIIGNSAGGVGAIEVIREIDKNGSIAVISDEKHHVYSRPMISYYLAGEISFSRIFYRPPDFYERREVDAILGMKAVAIDLEERCVILDNGHQIGFEKLLLATGGEPFVPQIAGLKDYEVFSFMNLDDSRRIRKKLDQGNVKNTIVLGGGLIGLKAAEGLVQRGTHVRVVELADRILGPVLDQQASGIIRDVLEKNGIEVITGHTIAGIDGDHGKVRSVILDNGERFECDLVIIAVGVRPRVELVRDTPIKIRRGIIVDKHMRTSVPGIYACGDCAEVYDFIADDFRLTPLWPTAHVGGRVAGSNMAGVEKEYVWGTGMNAVDFFGFPVISAGLINPQNGEELEVLVKLDLNRRAYRKFLIRDQRIVGMVLVNEVDRAGVILGLMRGGTDVTLFKDDLLRRDFGLVHLPRGVRREIDAVAV